MSDLPDPAAPAPASPPGPTPAMSPATAPSASPDTLPAGGAASPALYDGLSTRQRMHIIAAAIAVVLVNMAFAAWVMLAAIDGVAFGKADQATVQAFSQGIADPAATSVLRAKAIDAVANIKLVSNKQAITIVAFSGAFSLMAIGFALFVLGADGAFRMQGEGGGAKLVLSGTAPGLLCFVVAAAIVVVGVRHPSQMRLGDTYFGGVPAATGAAAGRTCAEDNPADCADNGRFGSDGSLKPAPGGAK